jgi:hypothetical protein
VNWSNARSDIKAICDIYKREGEVISRHDHHKSETGEAAIGILSSEIYHKSLISLSEGINKWRDFKRGKEDHH